MYGVPLQNQCNPHIFFSIRLRKVHTDRLWLGLEKVNGSWKWIPTNETLIHSNWNADFSPSPSHSCAFLNKTTLKWGTSDCNQLGTPICHLSRFNEDRTEEDKIFYEKVFLPTIDEFLSQETCVSVNNENICLRFVKLQMNFTAATDFCANRFGLTRSGAYPYFLTNETVVKQLIKVMDVTAAQELIDMVSKWRVSL